MFGKGVLNMSEKDPLVQHKRFALEAPFKTGCLHNGIYAESFFLSEKTDLLVYPLVPPFHSACYVPSV